MKRKRAGDASNVNDNGNASAIGNAAAADDDDDDDDDDTPSSSPPLPSLPPLTPLPAPTAARFVHCGSGGSTGTLVARQWRANATSASLRSVVE
jgi:hypothetical protein